MGHRVLIASIYDLFISGIYENMSGEKPSDKPFEITVSLVLLYRVTFLLENELTNLAFILQKNYFK